MPPRPQLMDAPHIDHAAEHFARDGGYMHYRSIFVEAAMRPVVILAFCVCAAPAAFAADAGPDAANDKQSYCINANGEFSAYEDGQTCRKGYQLAGGNCRLKDGRMIAVTKTECARQAGDVALP